MVLLLLLKQLFHHHFHQVLLIRAQLPYLGRQDARGTLAVEVIDRHVEMLRQRQKVLSRVGIALLPLPYQLLGDPEAGAQFLQTQLFGLSGLPYEIS